MRNRASRKQWIRLVAYRKTLASPTIPTYTNFHKVLASTCNEPTRQGITTGLNGLNVKIRNSMPRHTWERATGSTLETNKHRSSCKNTAMGAGRCAGGLRGRGGRGGRGAGGRGGAVQASTCACKLVNLHAHTHAGAAFAPLKKHYCAARVFVYTRGTLYDSFAFSDCPLP